MKAAQGNPPQCTPVLSSGPEGTLLEPPMLSVIPKSFLNQSSVPVPKSPCPSPTPSEREQHLSLVCRGQGTASQAGGRLTPCPLSCPTTSMWNPPPSSWGTGSEEARQPDHQLLPSLHKPWTQSTLPQLCLPAVTASWHQLSPPSICQESVQTNCENQRGSSNAAWTPSPRPAFLALLSPLHPSHVSPLLLHLSPWSLQMRTLTVGIQRGQGQVTQQHLLQPP